MALQRAEQGFVDSGVPRLRQVKLDVVDEAAKTDPARAAAHGRRIFGDPGGGGLRTRSPVRQLLLLRRSRCVARRVEVRELRERREGHGHLVDDSVAHLPPA